MGRASAIVLAIAGLAATWAGPGSASTPSSDARRVPDLPRYRVALTSDDRGFVWRGTERVSFRNDSDAPLGLVWVRLWDEGIRGCRTDAERIWNLSGGTAGAPEVRCSSVPITLDQPVAPGARGGFAFDLAIDVPARNDRFGHDGPVAMIGNALPVLAIRDGEGWHLDPYSVVGDSFYSQVADWRVALDHPVAIRVPATGVGTDGPRHGDRVTTTYVAPRVRDFGWVAGPLGEVDGRDANGVLIRTWFAPEFSAARARTALAAAERTTVADAASLGAYPYPELDVVLVHIAYGGMEYPTLVMTEPTTGTVVHEVSHQWWYGMVGDDQFGAPWLDEAFATYTTGEILRPGRESCVPRFFADGDRVTDGLDYWDLHPGRYFAVVYGDGACALHRLTAILGAERMAALMRSYWTAHRFGWSTTAAFQDAAQHAANGLPHPKDLTAFWDRFRIGS